MLELTLCGFWRCVSHCHSISGFAITGPTIGTLAISPGETLPRAVHVADCISEAKAVFTRFNHIRIACTVREILIAPSISPSNGLACSVAKPKSKEQVCVNRLVAFEY